MTISNSAPQHECLQRRLDLMRALVQQLRLVQVAMIELDATSLRKANCEAEATCYQLRLLQAEVDRHAVAVIDSTDDAKNELAKELSTTYQEVEHLCRVQAALIRRANSFATVLLNVASRCSEAYTVHPGIAILR